MHFKIDKHLQFVLKHFSSGILFDLLIYMAQNDEQEKTEKPTARKLEKAREEGNVARSTEISSVMLLVIATVVFLQFGGWMYSQIQDLFEMFFAIAGQGFNNTHSAMNYIKMAAWYGMLTMT